MELRRIEVLDTSGKANPSGDGVAWGNNAAWHCLKCGSHLGGRTADSGYRVQCTGCDSHYEIQRGLNKNHGHNLARALGVVQLPSMHK